MSQKYTSTITTDLQAIGNESDLLYYASDQVRVSSIEFNNRVGKFKQSVTGKSLPGDGDIKLPNQDFTGACYLQVKLDNIPASATLAPGWLFAAIKSLEYTIGTSNVSLVKIGTYDLFHSNFMSCETRCKREKMILLAGAGLNKTITPPAVKPTSVIAQLLLKLPFSTMSACKKKLLYDARLINTPIILHIEWNPIESFMGWSESVLTVPTDFSIATVLTKQNVLTNKSDSLYTEMKADNKLLYVYPYQHLQHGTSNRFPAIIGTNTLRTELTGYLSSDVLGIMFSVVKVSDTRRTGTDHYPNPFNLKKVQNILLEYNGQTVHNLPFDLIELSTLNICEGDNDAVNSVFSTATGDLSAGPGVNGVIHVYYLPFTPVKSMVFDENYWNTSQYKSQPLDLTFDLTLDATHDVAGQYLLSTTYIYNANITTKDLMSRLYFG